MLWAASFTAHLFVDSSARTVPAEQALDLRRLLILVPHLLPRQHTTSSRLYLDGGISDATDFSPCNVSTIPALYRKGRFRGLRVRLQIPLLHFVLRLDLELRHVGASGGPSDLLVRDALTTLYVASRRAERLGPHAPCPLIWIVQVGRSDHHNAQNSERGASDNGRQLQVAGRAAVRPARVYRDLSRYRHFDLQVA